MVGPGRGSVCGSLVAYCLGITAVDPIKYNLYFERFLNAQRTSAQYKYTITLDNGEKRTYLVGDKIELTNGKFIIVDKDTDWYKLDIK